MKAAEATAIIDKADLDYAHSRIEKNVERKADWVGISAKKFKHPKVLIKNLEKEGYKITTETWDGELDHIKVYW